MEQGDGAARGVGFGTLAYAFLFFIFYFLGDGAARGVGFGTLAYAFLFFFFLFFFFR